MCIIEEVSSSQFRYVISSCFLTDLFFYHRYCTVQQIIKISPAVHIN